MYSETPSFKCLFNFLKNYDNLDSYEKELFKKDDLSVILEYWNDIPTKECQRLLDLIESFFKKFKSELDKVEKSITSIESTHFYLGGHIKIKKNQPITDELIRLTEEKINNIDYSQCYGQEIYSVYEHNSRFEKFKKLYDSFKKLHKYKQSIEHLSCEKCGIKIVRNSYEHDDAILDINGEKLYCKNCFCDMSQTEQDMIMN